VPTDENFILDHGVYGVSFAGWSPERKRLEVYVVDAENPHAEEISVMVKGPSEEHGEVGEAFAERFGADFDPRRDGIAIFEELRRRCLTQSEQGAYPLVGGYIQHTAITSSGISTQVIHAWPDCVGQRIQLEAA